MTGSDPQDESDDKKFNETLIRMLKTPPKLRPKEHEDNQKKTVKNTAQPKTK